jgi:nitroimidazol reductase NimA-like FMN-containing flavoprotein (pyridoxamine 5'-phosphate oxidase superfamily)
MSRRDQIRMTDDEMRAFIASNKTIMLNSNGSDGYPHPMPMWFSMDDEMVISMTTFRASQKILNIRNDPRVSLLVESGTEYAELKGVVLYGRAELSEDLDDVIDALLAAAGSSVPADDPEAQQKMREVMQKTASKRARIQVRPEKIVSWDHAKLGGVY